MRSSSARSSPQRHADAPRPRARRPRLAGRAPRRALRPRVRLGRRASSGSSRGSPPTSTRPRDRAWIAEIDGDARRRGAVRPRTTETTAKLRTLLVEPSARGLGLGTRARRRRSSGTRAARRLPHADALDQRHPARRAPHLRARRLHAHTARRRTARSATTSSSRPGPLPSSHGPRRAEGAPGAAEEPLQGRPDRGPDHAQGQGHARRGRLLLRRHRPRDRQGRPAPGSPAATAACCARGDMLLEALVACAGVTLGAVGTSARDPDHRGPRLRRGRPRLPRHARRRQGGAGRLLATSACASSSTPTADDEQLATLLKLTERYCVVLQTLTRGRSSTSSSSAPPRRPRTTRARTRAGPRETRT